MNADKFFDIKDKKIMIVDDDSLIVKLIERFFRKKFNFECVVCNSGEACLKELGKDELPDLILLDINMPGLSGYDVCSKIRADKRMYLVPIIFISAYDKLENKITGFKLGVDDYLVKPFNMKELEVRAISLLNRIDHLIKLSYKDELTGLYNRRYFNDFMEFQILTHKRNNKPLSLIIYDIDFFKKINDTYGHLAGDFILQSFAKEVKKIIRRTDLVARIGGEEFVVVFPDTNAENAKLTTEKLRKHIEEMTFNFENNNLKITFSAGVAECRGAVKDTQELLDKADVALYEAKETGRNKIIISSN